MNHEVESAQVLISTLLPNVIQYCVKLFTLVFVRMNYVEINDKNTVFQMTSGKISRIFQMTSGKIPRNHHHHHVAQGPPL